MINQASSAFDASLAVIGRSVGIRGQAVSSSSAINYGGWFTAAGNNTAYGLRADASVIASGTNYGVAGTACNGNQNFAVYGQSCSGAGNWAGYFDGPTFTPGAMWTSSDENLKTNISNLTGATAILTALTPKTYEFNTDIEAVNLPEGLQYGLIAQELELVVPHAVRDVSTPERFDDAGNVAVESIDMKAVNYTQLIPLLIAGFKEQNVVEAANSEQIEELQSRLASLENGLAIARQENVRDENSDLAKVKKAVTHSNFPNPFNATTTIEVEIFEEGEVRIEVVNEKGDLIETLRNQTEVTGTFEVIWNSSNLPSGIYFGVIRHNGDVQVKKMLKY